MSLGIIKCHQQVVQTVAMWRQYIGEGVPVEIRWDRTGAQSFPLLAKGDWSAEAIFGKYGRFGIKAPGAVSMIVDSIGCAYRATGDDLSIDIDPVELRGVWRILNPGPQPAGMVAGGPGTILTVLSIVRMVIGFLNPRADLQLGGTISATAVLQGDRIDITFRAAPAIQLFAFFRFYLTVQRVQVDQRRIFIEFSGNTLIKSRYYDVA